MTSMEEERRWGNCPDDVKLRDDSIEEVILRLPPPAVARFKCASTRWRRRLSNPSFVDRYKARNFSLLGFLYNKAYNRIMFEPIPSNFPADKSTGYVLPNTTLDIRMGTHCRNYSYTVVNSSNGRSLLYYSNFTEKDVNKDPFYVVRSIVTGAVSGIPMIRGATHRKSKETKRFFVFGFAYDPYGCIKNKPNITIVEITSDALIGNRVRIINYSSLLGDPGAGTWNDKLHDVPINPNDFRLIGPSTFFNGCLHWLVEPSGVVAYNIREEKLSFSLMNIQGDMVGDEGFCNCVKKIRDRGGYSNGECSCRYLGESRDKLVYIRITGDFDFSMWILEDYCRGIWSHKRRIVVDSLPLSDSLYFGKVLAFDRRDARVIYLRVKRSVFSYNMVTREIDRVCEISKDYGGEDNCLGYIIPFELPRFPRFRFDSFTVQPPCNGPNKGISKLKTNLRKSRAANLNALGSCYQNNNARVEISKYFGVSLVLLYSFSPRQALPVGEPTKLIFYDCCPPVTWSKSISKLRSAKSRKIDLNNFKRHENNDILHLYHHFGVSQVAVNFFPHLHPLGVDVNGPPVRSSYGVDVNGPPVRSSYDFYAPNTYDGLLEAVVHYNDFLRVEACLYGSVSEHGPSPES